MLKQITVRCYAELNDFLPLERKQTAFSLSLKLPVTVAEVIEKLGIPLSEVDLVLINGQPSDRRRQIREKDYVSAYPAFETFDISGLKTAQEKPLRASRFILDAHLGKLAKYLRMLGFDALYRNDFGDDEIIRISREQNRIILTRDKALLRSPQIRHGYYVRAVDKHGQLIELVEKFDLYTQFKPFSRCMTCNTPLKPENKDNIHDRVDPETWHIFDEFFSCPECEKIFWKGSHFERMEGLILDIIKQGVDGKSK